MLCHTDIHIAKYMPYIFRSYLSTQSNALQSPLRNYIASTIQWPRLHEVSACPSTSWLERACDQWRFSSEQKHHLFPPSLPVRFALLSFSITRQFLNLLLASSSSLLPHFLHFSVFLYLPVDLSTQPILK